MKNNNKIIASRRSDVQSVLKILNGLIRVKAGRGWVNWLLKVSLTLRGGMTSAVARSAVVCVSHFYAVYKRQGIKGLVLRTKSLYILTMQAVGGRQAPPQALGPAVARSKSGLPRIIPRQHRIRIRDGDVFVLRLWLSWFSIYRVLAFPGKVKLNTITDPGVSFSSSFISEQKEAITGFVSSTLKLKGGEALAKLPGIRFFQLSKSTPVLTGKGRRVSGSPLGILHALYSLRESNVWDSFMDLANRIAYSGSPSSLESLTKPMRGEGPGNQSWFIKTIDEILSVKDFKPMSSYIGKLGFKSEAAGKVRVFAMVDCWTQWLLWPVHQLLFELLQGLPSDGTHDQFAPVRRLIDAGNLRYWCYDLSAATDRLPVSIQSLLLSHLFGEGFGEAWKNLLVGRAYQVPRPPKGVVATDLPDSVHYAVGQPMGALSSWAMLAITHHLIVQWAASRVGFSYGTFWSYAVLGDDVIIANGKVAGAYLQLMKQLGVGIGIHKSLVSRKGVLEFAKRYYVGQNDCSPVPFKELVAHHVDFESSAQFILKYKLGLRSIAALGGWGYRVRGRLSALFTSLPKKLSSILIWRVSPWGSQPHNLQTWFNIKSPIIRKEWIVQVTEMWPTLSGPPAEAFKSMASKTEAKVEMLRLKGYSSDFIQTRKKVKDIFNWFETGLYNAANKVGAHYNGLYWIQRLIWERSIPLLHQDLNRLKDASMALRHTNIPTDQVKILKWVDAFNSVPQVKDMDKIGEVRRLRRVPSPLWPTRLHRVASSGNKPVQS